MPSAATLAMCMGPRQEGSPNPDLTLNLNDEIVSTSVWTTKLPSSGPSNKFSLENSMSFDVQSNIASITIIS
jgi:hypothetical protein